MTYETFKALYEVQIAIGKFIDIAMEIQEDNELVESLVQQADSIGGIIDLEDNHWLVNPISLEVAWLNFYKKPSLN